MMEWKEGGREEGKKEGRKEGRKRGGGGGRDEVMDELGRDGGRADAHPASPLSVAVPGTCPVIAAFGRQASKGAGWVVNRDF